MSPSDSASRAALLVRLHGSLEVLGARPCRSPYCECTAGGCTHPGCFDARGLSDQELAARSAQVGCPVVQDALRASVALLQDELRACPQSTARTRQLLANLLETRSR